MSIGMSEKDNPTQSLADQVGYQLREDIIGGRLLPGMALVESELVERYQVSRNTIREALHVLRREGLTHYVRNRGVMVRTLGVAEVKDIFMARRTLELQALRGSKPLREVQLDEMQLSIRAAEDALGREDWQALGTHSLRFHQQIVALLGSPLLDEFFTRIAAQLRLVFAIDPNEERFQKPWFERDREIYESLSDNHKAAAAEQLAAYLDDSEQVLLEILGNTSFS